MIEVVAGRDGLLIGTVAKDRTAITGLIDRLRSALRHDLGAFDVSIGAGRNL